MVFRLIKLIWMLIITLQIAPSFGKDIRVAVGMALPPYYLLEQESGIELDIIKAALAYRGHTLIPVFVPFARLIPSVASGFTDAAAPANEGSGYRQAYYSDSHITYKNIAVSLKASELVINNINDLAGHSIMAFQNATTYLSPEFGAIVKGNPRYSEKSRQDLQINMLRTKRTEVIVLDEAIFTYYANMQGVDIEAEMNKHPIFDSVAYKVIFNDSKVRDDFNLGLMHLKQTGQYQKIVDSYLHQ